MRTSRVKNYVKLGKVRLVNNLIFRTCHSKYSNEKANISARQHDFLFRISRVLFLPGPQSDGEDQAIEEHNGYHAHHVHFLRFSINNNSETYDLLSQQATKILLFVCNSTVALTNDLMYDLCFILIQFRSPFDRYRLKLSGPTMR